METTQVTLIDQLAQTLVDKRAEDVQYIDITSLSIIADGFLIASGRSTVQVKALADIIEEKCEKEGIVVQATEGYDAGRWIILDLHDIMVHIFHRDEREFYNLERLWTKEDNIKHFT